MIFGPQGDFYVWNVCITTFRVLQLFIADYLFEDEELSYWFGYQ